MAFWNLKTHQLEAFNDSFMKLIDAQLEQLLFLGALRWDHFTDPSAATNNTLAYSTIPTPELVAEVCRSSYCLKKLVVFVAQGGSQHDFNSLKSTVDQQLSPEYYTLLTNSGAPKFFQILVIIIIGGDKMFWMMQEYLSRPAAKPLPLRCLTQTNHKPRKARPWDNCLTSFSLNTTRSSSTAAGATHRKKK